MEKARIKTTELGTTGLEITRVGFGAWALGGGGYDWGWGLRWTARSSASASPSK